MKRFKNRRSCRRGFTLMEMLIVLGILVIVFALAAPKFFGAREKANLSAAKVQIEAFRGALEKYYYDTNGFPSTEQGLQALFQPPADSGDQGTGGTLDEGDTGTLGEVGGVGGVGGATGGGSVGFASKWDGPYMNKPALPKDPWGNDYQYAYPPERGVGNEPDIWSLGPDGEDNTDDDICSWVTSQEGEGAGPGGEDLGKDFGPDKVNVAPGDVDVGGGQEKF